MSEPGTEGSRREGARPPGDRAEDPATRAGKRGGVARRRDGALHLLFVCTGNTCRSPMAETIARAKAAARGWDRVEVRSAGAGAMPGAPATREAVDAAAERGLDLTAHRATLLTREEVAWADLILAMSPQHVARATELGAGGRAALLASYAGEGGRGGGTVPDPIGGTYEEYVETYRRLEELIERLFERLEPEVEP